MAPYRILSLDGGGIRGIIAVVLIERLAGETGIAEWWKRADLIAGTSTGGLAALLLAAHTDIQQLRQLYEIQGKDIFHDSFIDDLLDLGNLLGAEYSLDNLEKVLRDVLGEETTLGDLQQHVLITSFDLDNEAEEAQERTWKPKLFHNFPGPDSDRDRLAYKVGLYTSAAPTYFPTSDGFVDGGVYAGNPAMCALAQSQDERLDDTPPLSDVVLLSIGSGNRAMYIRGQELDWGILKWGRPLVDLIMDGVRGIADFQCRQLLKERYHRIQVSLPVDREWPLDAVDLVPDMVALAEGFDIESAADWLRTHWS